MPDTSTDDPLALAYHVARSAKVVRERGFIGMGNGRKPKRYPPWDEETYRRRREGRKNRAERLGIMLERIVACREMGLDPVEYPP